MRRSDRRGSSRLPSFEAMYPTRSARETADEVLDALPLSTTLSEAIRAWEHAYLSAGGAVRGVKIEP